MNLPLGAFQQEFVSIIYNVVTEFKIAQMLQMKQIAIYQNVEKPNLFVMIWIVLILPLGVMDGMTALTVPTSPGARVIIHLQKTPKSLLCTVFVNNRKMSHSFFSKNKKLQNLFFTKFLKFCILHFDDFLRKMSTFMTKKFVKICLLHFSDFLQKFLRRKNSWKFVKFILANFFKKMLIFTTKKFVKVCLLHFSDFFYRKSFLRFFTRKCWFLRRRKSFKIEGNFAVCKNVTNFHEFYEQ